MNFVKNEKYDILTPNGWQSFSGIRCNGINDLYKVSTETGECVTATKEHRFIVNGKKTKVRDIKQGDMLPTEKIIKSVMFDRADDVYDIIEVENDNHLFNVSTCFYSENCDEFSFVRPSIAEDFWSANYPTISTSTEAKIIIISTPNGMFNLFHRIYTEAEHCENTFIPMKFTWRDVPGRNKAWADEQLKNLGKVKFAQEQLVEFLGSTNTVIDPNVLEIILSGIEEPIQTDLNGKLMLYEKPEKGKTYVMGIDVAKGTGENASVIQVLRVDSLIPLKFAQVATYISNAVDVYSFADVINRTSYFYNDAFIMCENNAEGSAVVNRLWWDHENPNLVNSGGKTVDLGIRANKLTKPKAVLMMKKLIEDGDFILKDRETIKQLASFIDDNGKFRGNNNTNDDCVSALYWGIYIVEMGILDGYHINAMEEKSKEEGGDDIWGILTDATAQEENFDWLFSKDNF